jgi:hypothetical protein
MILLLEGIKTTSVNSLIREKDSRSILYVPADPEQFKNDYKILYIMIDLLTDNWVTLTTRELHKLIEDGDLL